MGWARRRGGGGGGRPCPARRRDACGVRPGAAAGRRRASARCARRCGEHGVRHDRVEVDVKVEAAAEALHKGDGTAVRGARRQDDAARAGEAVLPRGHSGHQDAVHRGDAAAVLCQVQAQGVRQGEHPLPVARRRQDALCTRAAVLAICERGDLRHLVGGSGRLRTRAPPRMRSGGTDAGGFVIVPSITLTGSWRSTRPVLELAVFTQHVREKRLAHAASRSPASRRFGGCTARRDAARSNTLGLTFV